MQRKHALILIAIIAVLLLVVTGVATVRARSNAAAVAIPTTLTYQGHLLDDNGDPVADGTYSMSFSLWDDAATGTQVWGPEAQGSVQVTDGFFAVILGETSPIAASVLQTTTYLEIVVGGETLDPRQKLGAVAFALQASQAESVPWSGVTGEPLYTTRWPTWSEVTSKPGTFTPSTHSHPWSDVTGEPSYTTRWPAWSEVTSKPGTFAPNSHTHPWSDVTGEPSYTTRWPAWSEVTSKPSGFADGVDNTVPAGVITMWSGSTSTIPTGWALCDGSNGTPDLRNRFIVGAGDSYSVDDTGGSATMAHTHGVDLPSFAGNSGNNSGAVRHDGAATGGNDIASHPHSHSIAHDHPATTSGAASNTENRPPYYALAYIMKLP